MLGRADAGGEHPITGGMQAQSRGEIVSQNYSTKDPSIVWGALRIKTFTRTPFSTWVQQSQLGRELADLYKGPERKYSRLTSHMVSVPTPPLCLPSKSHQRQWSTG